MTALCEPGMLYLCTGPLGKEATNKLDKDHLALEDSAMEHLLGCDLLSFSGCIYLFSNLAFDM